MALLRPIAAAFGARRLSSVGWVTVEKLTQQALGLALFAILAPLLGPRPYGVFSVAMVFVGLSEFVLGESMAEVLVTLVEYDQSHVAAANLVGGLGAAGVGLVLAAVAPPIGYIFHDPDITRLLWALAPLPLISVLAAAPVARLRREMLFKRLALRSIASLALGGTAGIVAALLGAGVWALALQALVQRLAEIAIVWASVPLRLRFRWSTAALRDMRPIAANVIAGRAMMFAGGQAPRLIIGFVLGPTEVGLYTLANRFLDIVMFIAVFPRVAVGRIGLRGAPPGAAFAHGFSAMVRDVALLTAPLLLVGAAVLPDLYRIWLDARWLPGVLPAQLTLLGGFALALIYCFDAAFLAARLTAMFRRTSTLQAVTTAVTVLAAAPFGLDAACAALLLRGVVVLWPYVAILRGRCGIGLRQIFASTLRPVLGAALAAAALSLPVWRMQAVDPRLGFAGLVGAGGLGYLLYCWAIAREDLRALLAGILTRRT